MPTRVVILCLAIVASPLAIAGQTNTPPTAEPTAAIPSDCNSPELLTRGRPIMIPWRNGLALGISLAKQSFKAGEPITLYLWAENNGDTPGGASTCADLGRFKADSLDIYTVGGRRIPNRHEASIREQCSTNPRIAEAMSAQKCLRNFLIRIPAHTCVNGDSMDFTIRLTDNYDLPPGNYSVRPRREIDVCKRDKDLSTPQAPEPALTFSVVRP